MLLLQVIAVQSLDLYVDVYESKFIQLLYLWGSARMGKKVMKVDLGRSDYL